MSSLYMYPMHGYAKMLREGFRTRDAHMLEWLPQVSPSTEVQVVSRPDPFGFGLLAKAQGQKEANVLSGTRNRRTTIARVPNPRNPKKWWVTSARFLPEPPPDTPVLTFNPMLPLAPWFANRKSARGKLHLDLLDDWSVHHAFLPIRTQVVESYVRLFDVADTITANSEGTLALAHKHGRKDAHLLPNGCDPERFSSVSKATGPLTLGYIGKIGSRLDLELMEQVAGGLPGWQIVIAGPVLEADGLGPLKALKNVQFLGDVHYKDIPALLETFDVGWVPHGVAKGQVGGDAIKIYEYRAAGLPVLTTPIIGTRERPMDGVFILDAVDHLDWLRVNGQGRDRIDRLPFAVDSTLTWEHKTRLVATALGLRLA